MGNKDDKRNQSNKSVNRGHAWEPESEIHFNLRKILLIA